MKIGSVLFVVCVLCVLFAVYYYYFSTSKMFPTMPLGIMEGDFVQVPGTAPVYRIVGGKLAWVASSDVLGKYGWPPIKTISAADLAKIPAGPQLT